MKSSLVVRRPLSVNIINTDGLFSLWHFFLIIDREKIVALFSKSAEKWLNFEVYFKRHKETRT